MRKDIVQPPGSANRREPYEFLFIVKTTQSYKKPKTQAWI